MTVFNGVVGLDLSITSTGIARYDFESGGSVVTFVVGTDAKFGPIWERLYFSLNGILALVSKDDLVLVEGYAFGSKYNMAALAELGGLVKFSIWRKTGRWPVIVTPHQLKKFAIGVGKGGKEDMKLAAYKHYRKEFATNDECDAFFLARIGIVILDRAGPKTRAVEKAVAQAVVKANDHFSR